MTALLKMKICVALVCDLCNDNSLTVNISGSPAMSDDEGRFHEGS